MDTNQNQFIGKNHFFSLRVYYSHTDAGGVVYHSNYLDFAEHARTEMIDALGTEGQLHHMEETGGAFVVRGINIEYLRPARLDDRLVVESRITRCERFRLTIEQLVRKGDELLAELEVRIAYISLKEGRPMPMPEPWRGEMVKLIQD
ncbi:MAG: YbgC/FadM family acyl-CoA thioesterase [Spirochaetaceae bacterium]|jgi:acyl-CoA thioester hydrolase|nr:YbgC/FadM family acyl-CoA thioesterase [Spirochaetaceae bacterium]